MIYVVGIGPGGVDTMTPQAVEAIKSCEAVAGYTKYLELVGKFLEGKTIISSGMTHELERCQSALNAAKLGMNVALISSGDSGVYGMAGLMLEVAQGSGVDVKIIPGITAANSCAAILGAPLMNDYVTVSLSDLLTDWRVIAKRLTAACLGDFVICIYNPASHHRPNHLKNACDILLSLKDPETPSGYVRNAGRNDESYEVMTLRELRECQKIDMLCTVIVGNSQTLILDGKLITPRGYKLE